MICGVDIIAFGQERETKYITMTKERFICYLSGHEIGQVDTYEFTTINGRKMEGIKFGCVRCGKRYKEGEHIYSSKDTKFERFIRNRK